MELSKEVKQRYLEFCHCETSGHVYVDSDKVDEVCVQKNIGQEGNGLGENEYNTFSIEKQGENTVLCQVVFETSYKWEYDEYGGESPNNGEWKIPDTEKTIKYKVPENFDLYNPDFSQVEKIKKGKGRK